MTDDAIPAATLILVREGAHPPPQLLMVERSAGMAFAGGAMVFPGGRIDEADRLLAATLGGEDMPARVAAIRETLEETAVPVGILPLPSMADAEAMQAELADGASFADLLEARGMRLDPSALVPLARWVPKHHARKRFDTLFFVAQAPSGNWQPRPLQGECAGAYWLRAADVLRSDAAGSAKLIFPTRRTLERLAAHDSFAAIAADARSHPVDPITPWVEELEGEQFITIPAGLGFPVTREKMEGLWRG